MIKSFIIENSLKTISSIYPDYDSVKMNEIKYGLEAVYLSLTKVFVILLITLLLGVFKEAVLLLLFFNGLRTVAFGIHASKSWMCWVSSSILFIGYFNLEAEISIFLYDLCRLKIIPVITSGRYVSIMAINLYLGVFNNESTTYP